jgi:hypothetical protein
MEMELQYFIFTLHGIEPHDTSTIKLQVSHCTVPTELPRLQFFWKEELDLGGTL